MTEMNEFLRAFIWYIYLHFSKNVTYTGSHPSIYILFYLSFISIIKKKKF